MAGQRQPIDLVIAKGKKHLTKLEINQRKSEEVEVPFVDIRAPSYLPDELVDEFNDLSEKLKAINIMTELDTESLARYLIAKENYLIITNKLNKKMKSKKFSIVQVE